MPTRPASAQAFTPVVMHVRWSGLLLNDDGAWFIPSEHADRTVQVTGTFGGATVRWEGSNDPVAVGAGVPATGFTLTDQTGVPVTLTAPGGRLLAEAPRWVRPVVVGGDGTTALVADLVARR